MAGFKLQKILGLFLLVVQEASSFRRGKRGAVTSESSASSGDLVKSGAFGGNGGSAFDHWSSNGLSGAINSICCSRSSRRRSSPIVARIDVSFAGRQMRRGGSRRRRAKDYRCFDLLDDETITGVNIAHGGTVTSLQWKTSRGRTSERCGGGGGTPVYVGAPAGKHLMSVYGRTGSALDQIGFYWGAGGGSGSWQPMRSCIGCGMGEFRLKECSERTESSSNEVTQTWSLSATAEMKSAFFFNNVKVTGSYSRTTVARTESSFFQSVCLERTWTCDKNYLWQWTFSSNFDNFGTIKTFTQEKVCTDEPHPCCLPGTFTEESGPRNCTLASAQHPNTC